MRAHSSRLVPILVGATLLVLAAPASQASQRAPVDETSLVGTWVLDLSRSKYFPGPPPRSETRTYTATPEGVRGVVKRLLADGRVETMEYLANYDNEIAVTGTVPYDALKLTKVDEFTSEAVLTHAGLVYGTAKRVISRDGKTMTIAFQRRDTTISNTAIYRRQDPQPQE
jgi:hypothetical protein